jgi:predicted phosphoribosyltransferase
MMLTRFQDRTDAAERLAERLAAYAGRADVLVLALPRGGVPVAFEVARALDAPLDVFVVRKLGVPGREELAMGAIASGEIRVLNDDVVGALKIPDRVIEAVTSQELKELRWRERSYRGNRPPLEIGYRIVILVDDGMATGSTMRAAVAALRRLAPERIIVAVPTATPSGCAEIRLVADDCICCVKPDPFYAVGSWYDDFSQTTDEEVRDLLERDTFETTATQPS